MSLPRGLAPLDRRLTRWMARHAPLLLRWSLAVVFLWFGALKFVPSQSPAEDLAARTIAALSGGRVGGSLSLPVLAIWECLIGLGLLSGRFLRTTLLLLFVQMIGTLAPLLLFPHEAFAIIPLVPTLTGQYIIKNVVLISAGVVVGATVRGGHVDPEPGGAHNRGAT